MFCQLCASLCLRTAGLNPPLFACGECEVLSPLIHIGDSFPQYSLVNEPLIELSNPGASGSLFYLTSDDEFIIKTVQHKEAKFLQRLLPGYYMVSLGGRDGWAERGASWHVDKQHRFFSFFTVAFITLIQGDRCPSCRFGTKT